LHSWSRFVYSDSMSEQSFLTENDQKKFQVFNNPDKQSIFDIASSKILHDVHQIDSEEADENKGKFKFGAVFEDLAGEENRLKHIETEKQKHLRQIIERMYSEAELVLGTSHERPSKPDGVTVSFDEKGRVIIEEIIEFKSSENAFIHGLDKLQPPKTFATIGNIVNILNKLISGKKTIDIKPVDQDLSFEKRDKRDIELEKIKKEILWTVQEGEKITYSPDLKYKMIVPKGVSIPTYDPDYIFKEYGYCIKMEISESDFSKSDIYRTVEELSSHSK
jgi:hypothetical protein